MFGFKYIVFTFSNIQFEKRDICGTILNGFLPANLQVNDCLDI